jgi:nucleotide-binding universal stress UspA family protein
VCAVDLSQRSAETLQWGFCFASKQNGELRVVHAIDVDEESMSRGALEVRRYVRETALEQWERLKKKEGLTAPLCIAYGSVGPALRKAAHDLQADVVIIGRGHVKQPLGRLRTNSYAIIRESPCPVISV